MILITRMSNLIDLLAILFCNLSNKLVAFRKPFFASFYRLKNDDENERNVQVLCALETRPIQLTIYNKTKTNFRIKKKINQLQFILSSSLLL